MCSALAEIKQIYASLARVRMGAAKPMNAQYRRKIVKVVTTTTNYDSLPPDKDAIEHMRKKREREERARQKRRETWNATKKRIKEAKPFPMKVEDNDDV